MRIRILKTIRGADDGISVKTYEAGQEYAVSADLGTQLILAEAAEEITDTPESVLSDTEPETPEKPKQKRRR